VAALCAPRSKISTAKSVAEQTRVLYGGSTKPSNIAEIMGMADIDGALIGGAALDADSYADMVT
jgi:triosephosphate isomerase